MKPATMAQEKIKIEFRGDDEVVINDNTTIKSKPFVTFLRHVIAFLLGPQDGEFSIKRDYYDERISSYIINQDGEESYVFIGEDGIEVDSKEVKSGLLARALKRVLNAYFLEEGENEIRERENTYYIRAETPGG
jgi:hypothetical protein